MIPIVNPDGFNTSREAGQATASAAGTARRTAPRRPPTWLTPYEYQRKNCRVNNTDGDDPEQGDCDPPRATAPSSRPPASPSSASTPTATTAASGAARAPRRADLRRAATSPRTTAATGRSRSRETQNIRDLVSKRQVTTLITNHTFSNLVLRPPGIRAQGPPLDEPVYKALGDSMAAENGYTSQPSYELYDTTGGTEDWTYYATGGLGFTFEIGLGRLPPPVRGHDRRVRGHYGGGQGTGGGNREAYFKALENTADAAKRHSVIAGKAPAGATSCG